jgi:transcriptional regulator with XRE-family HTH domain
MEFGHNKNVKRNYIKERDVRKMNLEIADKLIALRKKKGMSQENVAEKLGLSRQAISRWERAESAPDIDNLAKLSKLYEISLDDLLNTNMVSEKSNLQEANRINNNNINMNDYAETGKIKNNCEKEDIVLAQIPFPFVIPAFIIWGLFGFHEGYNWFGKQSPNAMQRFPLPICVVCIYLPISFLTGCWYITWLILMIIPIYYIIAALIKKK